MKIVLVLHDIRSLYNIGSLQRSADGLGVSALYATGLTPYQASDDESRPPHVRARVKRELHKTALGAEDLLPIQHCPDISKLFSSLRSSGFEIVGLEQSTSSTRITSYKPDRDVALVLGSETVGLPAEILIQLDKTVEIPMLGKKESFNVSIAASMALYELRREELY